MRPTRLFQFAISLILLSTVIGCAAIKTEVPKTYKFEITSVVKSTSSFNRPQLVVTIRNTGTGTIYNVGGQIKAKRDLLIVDTASVYFAGLSSINPGESATDDGVFFTLTSHGQYDTLDFSGISYLMED